MVCRTACEHYGKYAVDQMRRRIEKVGHKDPGSKYVLLWISAFGETTFFLRPSKYLG